MSVASEAVPKRIARALSAVAAEAARLLLSDPGRYPPERISDHARWLLFEAPSTD
jgi:hypothetical protein